MTSPVQSITSHLHPNPSWDLADHPRPAGREETWRFTPLKRFNTLFTTEALNPLAWQFDLPAGASSQVITTATAQEDSWDAPVDLIAANAVVASADQVHQLRIAPEAVIPAPIVIDVQGDGGARAGHLLVSVGHHARATIVLRYRGSAELASKVEITADAEADLSVIGLQDWDEGSVHGGQFSVKIGRGAKVRTVQASIGKGTVRLVERAEFDGPGGVLEQWGLYFVRSEQHVEHRLFVDHNAPHTESHVDYRGALQGKKAHSVWIGDVLIRSVATDIETYETNKNLMLTEGCQADSVPNLEIETGDIRGAGHSSSTGRFDELQLFYLRSRGIPEDQARRLIVEGFFLDIIHRIGIPEVEARLIEALNEQLGSIEGFSREAVLIGKEDE